MYRHPRVMRVMDEAEDMVRDLFARYCDDPATLPPNGARRVSRRGRRRRHARRIGDFIAGMTDRFALIEHARLFDSTPELR